MSKEEGYYENGTMCIQVDNKPHSKPDVTKSYSQSEDEISRTEEDSSISEERTRFKKSVKFHRTRNRDSSSIRSYKPMINRKDTDKKWQSRSRKRASTISYKDDKKPNARGFYNDVSRQRKNDASRRQQISQTGSAVGRLRTLPLVVQEQHRPKTSYSSSPSSDQELVGITDSPVKRNRLNNHGNVSWTTSLPKPYMNKSYPERESENGIGIPQTDLMNKFRIETSETVKKKSKAGTTLPKLTENQTSQMNPKEHFDESLMIRKQKMKNELYKYLNNHSAVGVSKIPTLEATESSESGKKNGKTRNGKTNSEKRSGMMKPSQGRAARAFLKPLTSTVTVTPDQEEVISKWRQRLGTSSPPLPHSQGTNTSTFPSSFLRDSHIFTLQDTATQPDNESHLNPSARHFLIPEKDSPDISLEDVEFQKLLRSMSIKRSNEVFSADEEREIFLKIEMERTKKQIHYLEELARSKMEKLKAIRWKKKRALEEEAVLNEKLAKLLVKIQELRESESFAQLLDKQTQVFATKRIRPNIN